MAFIARAQQNYFVYLQADNKQPFYVKLNEKLYSSSASGYLVIPKLQNGTHNLSVGFPKNEWPIQVIPVAIANKDQGFMLKNFDSKGWGLFNMQTMNVIMANANLKPSENSQAATRTDEFSNTLADVVNTPSIKEIKKDEVKEKEPATPPVNEPKKEEVKEKEPVKAAEPAKPVKLPKVVESTTHTAANTSTPADPVMVNPVKKIFESKTADGIIIKYSVLDESKMDTVQVVILPEEGVVPKEESKKTPAETLPVNSASAKETKAVAGNDPKFIDIELTNPNAGKDTATKQQPKAGEKPGPDVKIISSDPTTESKKVDPVQVSELKMINSDCKSTATEDDFIKVRKKMIAQKGENEMISAAQKLFRQKCYSTEQVKNLSVLILTDDNKYKFFDTAYPFVYDTGNFKNLESQLTDPYFISRFKAMIRN